MPTAPRTGAERYFAERRKDPEFEAAYLKARDEITVIDALINELNVVRESSGLTKAGLARRAHTQPEAVRRLFNQRAANPTLRTVVALAQALDYELCLVPRRASASRAASDETPSRVAAPARSRPSPRQTEAVLSAR